MIRVSYVPSHKFLSCRPEMKEGPYSEKTYPYLYAIHINCIFEPGLKGKVEWLKTNNLWFVRDEDFQ